MTRWVVLVAVVGTMPAGVVLPDSVAPTVGGSAEAERAVCRINLRMHNANGPNIRLHWLFSKVRVRRGTWRKLKSNCMQGDKVISVLEKGDSIQTYCNLLFSCNAKRRYSFEFSDNEGRKHIEYYPSSDSYTTDQTIDLGDISRFFR